MLVGHGTRDALGTAEFFRLSERLAECLSDDAVVCPCLLEFQRPSIPEAWRTLMANGVERVTVAPLLLFSAGHAKGDIPGEVATVQAATPGGDDVRVRYARPISRQAAMIEAVRARLKETLRSQLTAAESTPRTAVVMVGRGSRDVCASSDMRVLSEVAVRGRNAGSNSSLANEFAISSCGLFTTFYAMAEPRLPATLDKIAASGRFDRIVIQPHLLFAGRLYNAIEEQTQQIAAAFPSIQFDVSPYLGPCDFVVTAIAARIREAA